MNKDRMPLFAAFRKLVTAMFPLLLAVSCTREKAPVLPVPTDSISQINKWVYDSMARYYYYYESSLPIPSSFSGGTVPFFSSLLHVSDSFSYINSGTAGVPVSIFDGYGFYFATATYRVGVNDTYLGVISFVHKNSAAWKLGLRRGMLFQTYNGVSLHSASLPGLLEQMKQRKTVKFGFVSIASGAVKPGVEANLSPGYFENKPVFSLKVFQANGKKTGYLCLTHFIENYDALFIDAFRQLAEERVEELVLDFRFNTGGSVASAAKLCMLVAGMDVSSVFGIYKGNRHQQTKQQSFEKAILVSGSMSGKDPAELKRNSLGLKRVFVLTGPATASAAELVVNNLKPYIEVIQIGAATYGKDMASTLITDQRTPRKVWWTIHPLMYKMYNARNQGDYSNGIAPGYPRNDLEELPVYELGETAESLLSSALGMIYVSQTPEVKTLLRKEMSQVVLLKEGTRSEEKETVPELLVK